jgi:branched-chain amino acid transport system ATP-binding protein
MTPLLELRDFQVSRGRTPVVLGVTLDLMPGEVLALVGRNGAGKTTLVEGIAGLHETRGELVLDGRGVDRSTRRRLRSGIALCAEGRSLFAEMSVWDNLTLGAYLWERGEARRRAEGFLERFPFLAERRGQKAGSMSGGEQQLLAVCRALMSRPRVLLLDEPTAGLAPQWRAEIAELIRSQAGREGSAVLLVDDNLEFTLDLADRVAGLSAGRQVFLLGRDEHPTPASILQKLLEAEQRSLNLSETSHV